MAYTKTDWTNNTSPYINATNLDKMETGIDEAHDAIDNTSTGHDHDGTDSKKVIASNITNTPAGNIVATDAQAAITELDGQDTTHAADTSTHGVTTIVGISESQTLTNKTIDGDDNTFQDIALTSLKNVDEQSFTNLLENGDFESWSAGAAAAPDGWTNSSLITIARENTIKKIGSYSAKLIGNSLYDGLVSTPSDYTRYLGRTLTLGCWVYSDIANDATIKIVDSESESMAVHQVVNEYEWVTITHTVDASATSLTIKLYPSIVNASNEAYFDGAILVEGSICPAFSPKPLVDDGIMLQSNTPSAANDYGKAGQWCYDANYIYVCTATDTWLRAAIATW